jgi:hypothetical protein
MMDPEKKEDNLTIAVAIVGLILFILLAIATIDLWNAANPPPVTPYAGTAPAVMDTPAIRFPVNPVVNLHQNFTEMYIRTHKADLLALPQNLSDSYEANYVPLNTARLHAAIEMARLMSKNVSGDFPTYGPLPVPGVDPTLVFDEVTSKRVCYDFYSAPSSSGSQAFVTVAADRLLGDSFVRAGFVYQDNEQMNLEKAQEYYNRNFTRYDIRSFRFWVLG